MKDIILRINKKDLKEFLPDLNKVGYASGNENKQIKEGEVGRFSGEE